MKKIFVSLFITIALSLHCIAQTTNTSPGVIDSPVFQFLTQGSNWIVAPYAIYDTTTKNFGGGIGAGYKLNDFVVPTMRLDYINNGLWVPSGSLQLQAPVTIMGKVTVIPFVFTGIATSLRNEDNRYNGSAVGIFGLGGAVRINSTKWYVPSDVLVDYERWTGGPFEDKQVRFGLVFKL